VKSHFSIPQATAAACAVAAAATMLNDNCAAQTLIAADYATNSTYASGWDDAGGQNGGYGWGPWSMSGTDSSQPHQHAMDRGWSQYNPFGVAWTLFNPEGWALGADDTFGAINGDDGHAPGRCDNPPDKDSSPELSRAGRAFPNGGLQPGQTFSTIIATPLDRHYYGGYGIVLSAGLDNIDSTQAGQLLDVGTFEYYSYGKWYANAPHWPTHNVDLYDYQTTGGVKIDVTQTGTNSYHLAMTPLGNPALAYSQDGTWDTRFSDGTNAPVRWVTYQQYNTDSNFYNKDPGTGDIVPTYASCGPDPTDFYIKSMTVAGLHLNVAKSGTNVLVSWPSIFTNNFTLEASTNLGAGAVWNEVSPLPGVVNDQNVVTNAIAGKQKFYRLRLNQ
jgi:hypothetical protein